MRVFKCPACGKRNRVAEGRSGNQIKCKACEHRFASADSEPFEEPSAKPAVGPSNYAKSTVVQKVLGDPSAALEGAIVLARAARDVKPLDAVHRLMRELLEAECGKQEGSPDVR